MNILLIANPDSHDSKWIEYIVKHHSCYVLLRDIHYEKYTSEQLEALEGKWGIRVLGGISDFSLLNIRSSFRGYKKISGIIKEYSIDVFHIMYAEPNALWALFRKIWNVPVIITTRGTDILKTIPGFFQSKNAWQKVIARLYTFAIRQANFITCTSDNQKESVLQLMQYPEQKVVIIRTGVEFDRVNRFEGSEMPEELEKHEYILFPRSMRGLYNHSFSLSAIDRLSEEIKKRFKFVFVDRDSSDQGYVRGIEKQMTAMKGCAFVFLNRQTQNQIFSLYKNASLVVMNPLSDGTPVSAIEAIAFKKPVIIGPLAYDRDLFGAYPLKLSAWDEAELASKIEGIINGKLTIDKNALLQHFYDRTDREKQMQLLIDTYNKLRASHQPFNN